MMAAILLFSLFAGTFVYAAEGDDLFLDMTTTVSQSSPKTYGEGYVPKNSGSSMKIPVVIGSNSGNIGTIYVKPVIDDKFPFIANNISQSTSVGVPIDFNFILKPDTVNGSYPITFECSYNGFSYDDVSSPTSIRTMVKQNVVIYVAVTGRANGSGGVDGTGNVPRIMVWGYETNKDVLFAGEQFNLDLTLKNVNNAKGVQNVKLTVKSDDAVFLPVGGTNSTYFGKVGAGQTVSHTFTFDINPSALAQAHNLTVDIAYEDNAGAPLTESAVIALPVAQQIRIKIDEPMVYSGAPGQPISLSMNVYNMGKSTLYNLLATVEGEGLMAEQSYYGGNLESGGTKTVDLIIIAQPKDSGVMPNEGAYEGDPSTYEGKEDMNAGNDFIEPMSLKNSDDLIVSKAEPAPGGMYIDKGYVDPGSGMMAGPTDYYGRVVLTFEDNSGKVYTEYKDFVATVMPEEQFFPSEPPVDVPIDMGTSDLTWLWITIGGLVVAGVVVLIVLRSKKRKRIIEDELL